VTDELRIGLSELLRKAMIDQDADFLKEGVRVLSQALMEMEVQEHVGAARHERTVLDARDSATATASAPGTRG
jgi:transposase-like protein